MLFSFVSGDAVRNCPPQTGNVSSSIVGVFVWIFRFGSSLLGRVKQEYGATFVVLMKPR